MIQSSTATSIRHGYCHCGCGQLTPIAKKTRPERGVVRGEPMRYISGHNNLQPRPTLPDHSVFSIDGIPCRQIALTDGHYTIVWDSDYEWLNAYPWSALGKEFRYAYTKVLRDNGRKSIISMQRMILGLDFGDKRKGDHKNGVTLDNRRTNLRPADSSQQTINSKLFKNNKSGLKGVSKRITAAGTVVYVAQGRKNGKVVHLGQRATPEDAHLLYALHAQQEYGEFIRGGLTMSEDDLPWGLA